MGCIGQFGLSAKQQLTQFFFMEKPPLLHMNVIYVHMNNRLKITKPLPYLMLYGWSFSGKITAFSQINIFADKWWIYGL